MTKIEWTNETWNPVIGCSKISAGCQNCYAERMAWRLATIGPSEYRHVIHCEGKYNHSANRSEDMAPRWNGNAAFVESQLHKPLKWRKPRNIFACSMGDFWHATVNPEWRKQVYDVVRKCPRHTFQFLTKRPENINDWPNDLLNAWLGVTAENQEMADKRIPTLLDIPAAVRFVSLEPLLGPIDFKKIYGHDMMCCVQCGYVGDEPYETDYETPDDPEGWPICPKCGETNCGGYNSFDKIGVTPFEMRPFPKIDWVIVGCESGKNRRECKLEWVKRIVEQCTEEDVPVFVKQIDVGGKLLKRDKKTGEYPAEWPEHLRRQEMPEKAGE
jgi:protein gp37